MPTSFTSWSSVFDRFDNHSDSVFSGSLSSNALVLSSRTFCFSLTILSRSAFLSSVRCENLQLSIKLHIPVLRKFLHGRFDSSSWRTISGFLKFRIDFEWLIKKIYKLVCKNSCAATGAIWYCITRNTSISNYT